MVSFISGSDHPMRFPNFFPVWPRSCLAFLSVQSSKNMKKGKPFGTMQTTTQPTISLFFLTSVGGLSYQQFFCLVQSRSHTSSSSVKHSELLLSASQTSSSHDFVTMNNLWVRICRFKVCCLRQALSTGQVRDQELSKFRWLNCNARNAQWYHGHS